MPNITIGKPLSLAIQVDLQFVTSTLRWQHSLLSGYVGSRIWHLENV